MLGSVQVHAELQELTRDDLVAFYLSKVVTTSKDRRALVVSSTSQQHSEVFEPSEGQVLIDDVMSAKSGLHVSTPTCNSIGKSNEDTV